MLKDTQDLTSSTLDAWDGRHWCHRNCEKIHADSDFLGVAKSICKAKCNSMYDAPEHPSQGPTDIDVSDTLRGIGDNFHALADSFSVL
ncbi:hypothetical protein [Wolbachia endosymbiont of Trichogramma kaykai]|uniref:hypothetical protein n=1 Tax=Wolbachia endosymbiont of Trichogramma kaykai TaxID=444066 RepID=UPI0038923599